MSCFTLQVNSLEVHQSKPTHPSRHCKVHQRAHTLCLLPCPDSHLKQFSSSTHGRPLKDKEAFRLRRAWLSFNCRLPGQARTEPSPCRASSGSVLKGQQMTQSSKPICLTSCGQQRHLNKRLVVDICFCVTGCRAGLGLGFSYSIRCILW